MKILRESIAGGIVTASESETFSLPPRSRLYSFTLPYATTWRTG